MQADWAQLNTRQGTQLAHCASGNTFAAGGLTHFSTSVEICSEDPREQLSLRNEMAQKC